MTAAAQPMPKRRKRSHAPATGQESHYAALGVHGVKYDDAMKVAADVRRELQRRIEEVDRYLSLTPDQYRAASEDRSCRPAIEKLNEIRSWFSGELEVACRVLRLDSADVAERAAILEVDSGYTRRQAETIALREFLQHHGRYDGLVKVMVDSGEVLDLAREYINDRDVERLIKRDGNHPLHPLPQRDRRVIAYEKAKKEEE